MLCAHNELNQVLVFYVDRKDLADLVDANHAISGSITDSNEDKLVCNALAVDQGCA